MSLEELQKNWEAFGKSDPLRAILGHPESWDVDQFFATGVSEINELLGQLDGLSVQPGRSTALDFGCGVGRLTQALARHFDECHGVDIAPPMVELARRYNSHGDRCHYHINQVPHLGIFPNDKFDLIYSNITLQHMEPQYAAAYIKEFVRVLRPGGVLAFQLPSEPAVRPIPQEAFRARIVVGETRLVAAAGSRLDIDVRVENESPVAWPADQMIRLGNHWLDEGGAVLLRDDGRVAVPLALGSGESVSLSLPITVPRRPGAYLLEFDLVQEKVSWFKNRGSKTVRVPVTVVPNEETGPGSDTPKPVAPEAAGLFNPRPRMLMFATPKHEVMQWVSAAGGRVVDVRECQAARSWISYLYFATRP
jgi:SAM-dependent methyltransferase